MLVDGYFSGLPVVDLELDHGDHVQVLALFRCRLSLKDHRPLRFTEHVQDLDLERAAATGFQLSEEAKHLLGTL